MAGKRLLAPSADYSRLSWNCNARKLELRHQERLLKILPRSKRQAQVQALATVVASTSETKDHIPTHKTDCTPLLAPSHYIRDCTPLLAHPHCIRLLHPLLPHQNESTVLTPPLPANERTFLGYLRTSVALSMLGVIVAQLYRLQHHPSPSPIFGYFILSKPISAILQCSALGMAILGAIRYFRQQAAMARGKVHAGGWEVMVIVVFSSLVGRYWCWVVRREFGHLK